MYIRMKQDADIGTHNAVKGQTLEVPDHIAKQCIRKGLAVEIRDAQKAVRDLTAAQFRAAEAATDVETPDQQEQADTDQADTPDDPSADQADTDTDTESAAKPAKKTSKKRT